MGRIDLAEEAMPEGRRPAIDRPRIRVTGSGAFVIPISRMETTMPSVKQKRSHAANLRARQAANDLDFNRVDTDRPCVHESCQEPIVPECPTRLCGKHLREVYAFASDYVTERWDGAVREYVSTLHDTFKPPAVVKQPLAGWVYFIRFGDRVKVGYTTKPRDRFKSLPYEEILGVIHGTRDDEAAWHRLLADFHVVGEWFRSDPAVLETIARVVGQSA